MRKLLLLSLIVLVSLTSIKSLGGLEDTLRLLNRENLQKIAIKCEEYDRKKLGKEGLIGGLHDYINSLNEQDIMKIIFDYTKVYPELNSLDKLKEIAEIEDEPEPTDYDSYLKSLSREELVNLALKTELYSRKGKQILGGLHDYIEKLDDSDIITIIKNINKSVQGEDLSTIEKAKEIVKEDEITMEKLKENLTQKSKDELVHIALVLDAYDNERSLVHKLGGLHDYAHLLSESELVDAIMTLASKRKEVLKENFIKDLLKNKSDSRLVGASYGGLEDYLWRMSESEIRQMAIAAESYDRKKRGVVVLGGLEDYADSLSKEELYGIITKYVKSYPELRTPGVLEELSNLPQGGYSNLLGSYDIEKLRSICLSIEKYDRTKRQAFLIGGLHDYIMKLTTEDLVNYIRKMSLKYPELRNKEKLEEILANYKN